MTNEERQTVIQALEAALEVLDDVPTWSNAGYAAEAARKALAILRSEPKPMEILRNDKGRAVAVRETD